MLLVSLSCEQKACREGRDIFSRCHGGCHSCLVPFCCLEDIHYVNLEAGCGVCVLKVFTGVRLPQSKTQTLSYTSSHRKTSHDILKKWNYILSCFEKVAKHRQKGTWRRMRHSPASTIGWMALYPDPVSLELCEQAGPPRYLLRFNDYQWDC